MSGAQPAGGNDRNIASVAKLLRFINWIRGVVSVVSMSIRASANTTQEGRENTWDGERERGEYEEASIKK